MASIATAAIMPLVLKPAHLDHQLQPATTINAEPCNNLADKINYLRVGFAFSDIPKPLMNNPVAVLDNLESSLSLALSSFFTLTGEEEEELEPVEIVQATAHRLDVGSLLSPFADQRTVVRGLFPMNGSSLTYNYEELPLFAAQLTQLADGLFLGCSFNHSAGDLVSFARFLSAWAEISRTKAAKGFPSSIRRWFSSAREIKLPCFTAEDIVKQPPRRHLSQRMFHFSSDSVDRLQERAKNEGNIEMISSFEALSALVWRCVARARRTAAHQETTCWNAGNCTRTRVTAEELLSNCGLGRAARLLHDQSTGAWETGRSPKMYNKHDIAIAGSPELEFYGCDFGFGRPAGLRSSESNWFDGSVMCWPGPEEDGSIELEMCLSPQAMYALESDQEFTDFLSLALPLPAPVQNGRLSHC